MILLEELSDMNAVMLIRQGNSIEENMHMNGTTEENMKRDRNIEKIIEKVNIGGIIIVIEDHLLKEMNWKGILIVIGDHLVKVVVLEEILIVGEHLVITVDL